MHTPSFSVSPLSTVACSCLIAAATSSAFSQGSDLSDYYGFDGLEVMKIDVGAGPINAVDLDGDDHGDLIVVNNRKNRIELHHQKPGATEADQVDQMVEANEIPEHWRFRRVEVPAINQVRAVLPHDFDGDGLTDIIYAGTDPGAHSKVSRVQQQVSEVKEIMMDNIEKVLDRGEKIELLVDKTENLRFQADNFHRTGRALRRRMWWQNLKMKLVFAAFVLVVILILFLSFCYSNGNDCTKKED